ncbi:lactose ABC transporter permease [Vallitalea longa]|uniref:Lactose ABC transporter permease n=1 Tax=Vallitalea longa TaxID=2936439 RepID=A0A9W5YA25_9FIRM|nr:sugar ABC transporter permease [Vallitalea longa]GKX30115.1 lactose ABC transporter permease [Vallitalea longa]
MDKKSHKFISAFRLNKKTAPYYFMLPVLLIFAIFMVYPIINSLILSFNKFEFGEFHFVGFNNYKLLLHDPIFKAALINTFIYLIIQVPIMIFFALLLANTLNQNSLKCKTFFRISIFMPSITSLVAYSLVFMLLLNTEYGLVNYILKLFHIPAVDWLNKPTSARISIIIAVCWRWTGYNMIILLAGLKQIPANLYEACAIDGANRFQTFFKVTIPILKPIILFCTITSTIGTLQLFDESYILTQGGPDNATITISHYLYNSGFKYVKFGYASAISYVLVIIIAILSFIQFKVGDEK